MLTTPGTASPRVELDESNVADYLLRRGLLHGRPANAAVRSLSGGYVNNVFRVEAGDRVLVVKQSLDAAQRTVLHADIGRALVEVAAMKAITGLLGPLAPIPRVVDDDPENYVTVMTAAPNDAILYDTELLAGRFHPGTGRRIGAYAGELHARTYQSPEIAAEFGSNPGFDLRDQSIRSAAAANPEFQPLIESALRRNRDEACVLVDADITPKNILVHSGGITKLDFECAQWGHPALDLGIVLAHFVMLGFARPTWRRELLHEARGCYDAYTAIRPEASAAEFAVRTGEFAAIMMLGRADGDFIFDYLVPHRATIRSLVGELAAGVASVDEFFALADAALAGVPA